jgi:hypothetical protein
MIGKTASTAQAPRTARWVSGDPAAAERFRRLREDERRNRDRFLAVLRALDPADPAE